MYRRKNHHIVLACILWFAGQALKAQDKGFIQTDIVKKRGLTADTQLSGLADSERVITRDYVDGLGRPIQSIVIKGGASGKDLIQPLAYNGLGMQPKHYLPYAGSDGSGSFRGSAIAEQASFYGNGVSDKVQDDSQPWSQEEYEASPLQRLLKAGSVGDGFQTNQHYKTLVTRPSASADYVVVWLPDGSSSGYYSAGKLSVTDATDEHGMETLGFANDAGQTVLKRQIGPSSTWIDTYYIYNDGGQAIYVVQPKAVALMQAASSYSLSVTGVDKLLFKMVYDGRGRLVEKTVPSSGAAFIVYDPLNRPVLVQDAKLRAGNKWNYIKYDVKGRVIGMGIYTDATHTSRYTGSASTGMQDYVDALDYSSAWYESRSATQTNGGFYTNSIFPTSSISALAYTYYDDYDVDYNGTADYTYQAKSLTGEATPTGLTRGVVTATSKCTIGSGFSSTWLTSYMFYDKEGHLIQVRRNNHMYSSGLHDSKTIVPDFTGKTMLSLAVTYSGSSDSLKILAQNRYDHMDRLVGTDQKYNSGGVVHIAKYTYNEMGQLVAKQVHYTGSAWLQKLDYRYNIRGQLTSINNAALADDHATANTNDDSNDVFGMELFYEGSAGTSNTAFYNGRLSAVKWMSKDASGTATNQRNYNYAYDALNRLTAATYQEKVSGSWNGSGAYDEKDITYDYNGNITALKRNTLLGGTVTEIDNLTYTYDGNQLTNVADLTGSAYTGAGFKNLTASTSAYTYDGTNGNLTTDPKKGLSLDYNDINKTNSITLTSTSTGHINYTYDAGGTLLRKDVYNTSGGGIYKTTDYVDGIVYENGSLAYFAIPEGRVRNSSGTFKNEYVITDQQGNARVNFEDNGSGSAVVRQENSYYPFGLVMGNSPVSTPSSPNHNLYNAGAEWQNDYGDLPDYYQTFYRNYDASIGRFVNVDPQAESAESMTTYQYAYNNPGMLNDPMGDLVNLEREKYMEEQAQRTASNGGVPMSQGMLMAIQSDENSWVEAQKWYSDNGMGTYAPSNYWAQWGAMIDAGGGDLAAGFAQYREASNQGRGVYTYFHENGDISFMGGNGKSGFAVQSGSNWGFVDVAGGGKGNQTGRSVSMGGYGTLNILAYYGYSKDGMMGVEIKLGLNNITGYKNLNWVQTITTNSPLRPDLKSPYFDHLPNNPTPFYRIGSDFEANLVNKYGYDLAFYDRPTRSIFGDNISWKASLTLVGVIDNTYFPLFTINYGFTIQNGIYNRIPMTFSSPIPIPQTYSPSFPKNGP